MFNSGSFQTNIFRLANHDTLSLNTFYAKSYLGTRNHCLLRTSIAGTIIFAVTGNPQIFIT